MSSIGMETLQRINYQKKGGRGNCTHLPYDGIILWVLAPSFVIDRGNHVIYLARWIDTDNGSFVHRRAQYPAIIFQFWLLRLRRYDLAQHFNIFGPFLIGEGNAAVGSGHCVLGVNRGLMYLLTDEGWRAGSRW